MSLTFRRILGADGELMAIERVEPWPDEIELSPSVLAQADPRFMAHGDGLVTFTCVDETATYSIVGERQIVGYADPTVLLARLRTVRPTHRACPAPGAWEGA